MDLDLSQHCDIHTSRYACPDALIDFSRGRYGLVIVLAALLPRVTGGYNILIECANRESAPVEWETLRHCATDVR